MVRTLKYATLLLLLAICSSVATAQVRLSIPDTSGVSGTKLTIPVYVDTSLTGKGVTSYQIQLSYNSSYLALDSVISTGSLSQSFGAVSYNGSTSGIVTIASAGATALSGTGVLVYVRFRLLNSGNISVSFSGGTAKNFFNEGNPAIVSTNGGINIIAAPTIGVSPTSSLLTVGDQQQFTAYNGITPYHWSLTNPSVASIDSNGLLTATSHGFTKVVARDFAGTIDTTSGVVEIRAFRLFTRDTSYIQGQTFNLPVYSTDLTGLNITSGTFQLQFNQNILTPTGVVQTGILLSSYPAVVFNNSSSGVLNLSFAGTTPLSGSGVLMYIQFKVSKINSGGTSIPPAAITFNENLLGNSTGGNFQTINLAVLNISPSTASLIAGDTLRFTATGGTPPYVWTTSDSTVASIGSSGLLTALKGGSVTVRATDIYGGSGVSGTIQVYDTRVSIPDTGGTISDTVDVPVYISPLTSGMNVQSMQATITYDSSVIHALGIVSSGTMTSGWTYSTNISGGQINFAGAGVASLNTPGTFCKIRFVVPPYVTSGRASNLNIQQFLFNQGSPRASLVNGYITVSQVTAPVAPTLVSPANGATGVVVNPTLTWNSSSGATSYRLQVSADSTFATTTYDASGLTTTSKSISGLANLTKYYWRVDATNAGGTSGWSTLWNFTTIVTAPPAPTLSSPANGSTGVSTNSTVTWNPSTGATSYRVQVSADSTFATTTYDTSGVTATSKIVSGLTNLTKYYWRVDATNAGGTSGWSTLWNFMTVVAAPSAPTLSSPANGSTGVSTNPTVTWNPSTGATSYRVQVSADSTFATTTYDTSGVTATSKIVSGLTNLTKYYWRVDASNAGGTSDWSTLWNFTTIVALPPAPTLSSPANGSAGISTSPTLAWNSSSGATSYRLQVSADSTFTTTTYDSSGLTATSKSISGLTNLTKYYWRVDANNTAGTSGWSAVWNFTTVVSLPTVPVLVFPVNGSEYQRADTLFLQWNRSNGAVGYHCQLSTNLVFSSYVVNDSTADTTRKVMSLSNFTKYYWRVSSYNAGGGSAFTGVDSFTTIISAPAVPSLISPVGISGQPRRTTFTWSTSPLATKYHIQVASKSDLDSIGGFKSGNIVFDSTFADTTKKLNNPLTASTTYYWHVSATDTGGTSAYSVAANYTTGTGIDAVSGHDGIPNEFGLFQNYPNPFNPTTTISFDITRQSYVRLVVYDAVGREVRTLVDEAKPAGSYTVRFDASILPSGLYFYRLTANEHVSIKKMILLK